jgi:hypothetical protein
MVSAHGVQWTPRPMSGVASARACSTRPIRRMGCGPTPTPSAAKEAFMATNGFVSHVQSQKAQGDPLPRRAHLFAEQKDRMDLFIRTIGIARATIKIGLGNLVFNIKRLLFLRRVALAKITSRYQSGVVRP